MSERGLEREFQTADFFGLHTPAVNDSSDDGDGELPGLPKLLDYLQWLEQRPVMLEAS
jgi:hypothetical protein